MADELEAPSASEDLYLARGAEVNLLRPWMQGDVFDGVAIPGLDDEPGLAAIVTHPCSMRVGSTLKPRLQMARVKRTNRIPLSAWPGEHFRIMPLPDCPESGQHSAIVLEEAGLVRTDALAVLRRVACLDSRGLVLLQQRLVHNQTRVAIASARFWEQCAHVFHEADLLEEWLDTLADSDVIGDATSDFDRFIRAEGVGGQTLQGRLREPSEVPGVRRAVRQEIGRRSTRADTT